MSEPRSFSDEIGHLWDVEPVDDVSDLLVLSCAHHGGRLRVDVQADGEPVHRCPRSGCTVAVHAHIAEDDADIDDDDVDIEE